MAEIKELIGSTEATMAIFDNDLSPSQMRVLTEDLGVQVLDRSGLILDILPSVPKQRRAACRSSWRSTNICCRA